MGRRPPKKCVMLRFCDRIRSTDLRPSVAAIEDCEGRRRIEVYKGQIWHGGLPYIDQASMWHGWCESRRDGVTVVVLAATRLHERVMKRWRLWGAIAFTGPL